MATHRSEHPYLDLFTSSLASPFLHGPVHDRDPPPVEDILPLSPTQAEARPLLELLLGADHDLRDDHSRAAGINLALAETRLRMAIGRKLEDRGITTPAEIGVALGMPVAEATGLLTRRQWREGDVALLQAAAARLGVQVPG